MKLFAEGGLDSHCNPSSAIVGVKDCCHSLEGLKSYSLAQKIDSQSLASAIAQLPPKQKALIALYYLDGYPLAEIAMSLRYKGESEARMDLLSSQSQLLEGTQIG